MRGLQPSSFVYTHQYTDNRRHYGFIAQDVETLLTELDEHEQGITQRNGLGEMSMSYLDIIAILVKGYQRLDRETKELKLIVNQSNY